MTYTTEQIERAYRKGLSHKSSRPAKGRVVKTDEDIISWLRNLVKTGAATRWERNWLRRLRETKEAV